MRTVIITSLFAFACLTISASFEAARAAAPGAMSGKSDYGSKGYDQAAKEKKAKTGMTKKKPQ
jgi:hypothetical protein